MPNKKDLSERDITSKYILPALLKAGWDMESQIREEVYFTDGRIFVRGKKAVRGQRKRADILLYYKPNIPVAVIEVKDNKHPVGAGMQQALNYARILDVPVAYSTNGDSFLEHDYTADGGILERPLGLEDFPNPAELWQKYKRYKGIETEQEETIASFDYHIDGSGKTPRYYQQIAINRTVEAIAKGQKRALLVMATGTGKTYTAFQIIYRLWKSGTKKRILFLADRNFLISQTQRGDFRYFRDKMTIVRKKIIDKAFEIYLALYQGLTNYNEEADAYRKFSPNFFDLVVIDECHRGSAAEDSAWRAILDYFSNAVHIGLTATPRETSEVSTTEYFGKPLYTYSLKQGIEDGFLAPYKVLRVGINIDLEGWRPDMEVRDSGGNPVEDRIYNISDYDRTLVIDDRTKLVARKIAEYLHITSPFDKTIVFCVDVEHAERMRQALANACIEEAARSDKYVMRITGDDENGKRELDNFINPEEPYPVIATTSKLMSTGVDAQTCKLIVLDSNINSMTEFKQIIGRGTRINEEYGKQFFTIMDFRNVTNLFADPDFDGEPVQVKEVNGDDPLSDDDVYPLPEDPAVDPLNGETIDFDNDDTEADKEQNHREKIYVSGVDVSVLHERRQYLDLNGKLITGSLREYTKKGLLQEFRSLDDFLATWNAAEKKQTVIDELEKHGILIENLMEEVKKEMDAFDLICHIAWDKPALSRRERADKVKKRDYFTKYGEKAQAVLWALLDKYAASGIENIEELSVLKVEPLSALGTPQEIIAVFGGKKNYLMAIHELETELYRAA